MAVERPDSAPVLFARKLATIWGTRAYQNTRLLKPYATCSCCGVTMPGECEGSKTQRNAAKERQRTTQVGGGEWW